MSTGLMIEYSCTCDFQLKNCQNSRLKIIPFGPRSHQDYWKKEQVLRNRNQLITELLCTTSACPYNIENVTATSSRHNDPERPRLLT